MRLLRKSAERKGGRVVECAGLEIRYSGLRYRGFESHPFRHSFQQVAHTTEHLKQKQEPRAPVFVLPK